MKHIITIIMLLATTSAMATQYEILFHAEHYDITARRFTNSFNNNVHGAGIIKDNIGFGIYHNSFRKTTFYLVYIKSLSPSFGIEAGISTGYENIFGNMIQPIMVGYYQFNHFKVRIIPGPVTAFGFSYVWRN